MTSRVRQIDFLRGIAVILVLFRHHWVGIDWLQRVGWIGVDLFFVLSGFLVSGLLFSEYKRYGNIKAGSFLIRRGFKIYPLFYLSLFLSFSVFLLIPEKLPFLEALDITRKIATFVSELLFIQNYFVYIWGHHWSLAIEEHFYISIAIILPLFAKLKLFERQKVLLFITLLLFALAITLRFLQKDGFTQTHLRFDSLLAGVVISYFYHFSRNQLEEFYQKHRKILLVLSPLLLSSALASWESDFIRTIGFTFIYIGFSILLMEFILNPRTDDNLSKFGQLYGWIAQIGVFSYGIYLFHFYIPQFIIGTEYVHEKSYIFTTGVLFSFLVYFFGSIAFGIAMSKLVEIPMLKIRDKFYPRRMENVKNSKLFFGEESASNYKQRKSGALIYHLTRRFFSKI